MSDPKVTRRKVSDYTPDPHNANAGTERGQYMVDASVEQVGLARSIVAANDGTIPAGNKTLQAAADAGIEDVIEVETDGKTLVVVKRTDWDTVDSEPARRYAYFDNRASEVGLAWDAEQVLADLSAGVDLEAMFHEDELGAILATVDGYGAPPEDPGPQVDRAGELREKWQTERGQVWEVPSVATPGKSHRIMCGDSTSAADVDRLMGGEKAQAVITDPPYGIGAGKMNLGNGRKKLFVGNAWDSKRPDILKSIDINCPCIIWGGNYFSDVLPVSKNWLCWDKKNPNLPFSEFELAWTNIDINTRILHHHWGGEVKVHATQKPAQVLTWCISFAPDGVPVYDPFIGSGTTAVAAEQTGRICYGMEIEPKYVAVTLERLAGMGLEPELVSNG
jgi:hypothetical protein